MQSVIRAKNTVSLLYQNIMDMVWNQTGNRQIMNDFGQKLFAAGQLSLQERLFSTISNFRGESAPIAVEDLPGAFGEVEMSSAIADSLTRVEAQRDRIVAGESKIGPGQPLRLSEGASLNDAIAQGDLNLVVREDVPKNYTLRTVAGGQLVPGENIGAKHIVEDTRTVEIFDPPNWGPTYDELNGPFLRTTAETVIGHPVHGNVTLPAGFVIECRYQRVWDQEQARERRQRD